MKEAATCPPTPAGLCAELQKVADNVRQMSIEAFKAIDGAGMSRVDFLLARKDHSIFVNEVNTIPGFTTISMFANLWSTIQRCSIA